ncbi:MAG TPA: hypothetical protein DCG12_10765 [Planctomycetaceae bacterium]|nr:hypothetical protein [Planctomycetaceae bacterium]
MQKTTQENELMCFRNPIGAAIRSPGRLGLPVARGGSAGGDGIRERIITKNAGKKTVYYQRPEKYGRQTERRPVYILEGT